MPRTHTIDVLTEELLDFNQAGRLLHTRPHKSTWHRWRHHGVHGVRLATDLVGGRRLTSREAIAEFVERVTAAADGTHVVSGSNQEHAALLAAEKYLSLPSRRASKPEPKPAADGTNSNSGNGNPRTS